MIDELAAFRDPAKKCACGCGEDPRIGSKYAHPDRCRMRAYRKRVEARAAAAGLPARASLRALDAAVPTRPRNGDAQTRRHSAQRRRRDGVSVYLPTVELAEGVLGRLIDAPALSEATLRVARALDRKAAA